MKQGRLLSRLGGYFGERLVRVERSPRFADPIDGYVVGVGTKWLLLARTSEGGALSEGWIAVRLKDVTRVRRLDRRFFCERYARSTIEWPPCAPHLPIDLDTTSGLLTSMAWNAPLVAFEQEHHRHALQIGMLLHHEPRRSVFVEVTPRARWNRDAFSWSRRRMTAVSVGDDYLRALATVAGPPPAESIDRFVAKGAEMPAATPPARVLRLFFDWGHDWPLWEAAGDECVRIPADYGLSPTAVRLVDRWRAAWVAVADPDLEQAPTAQQLAEYRRAAAAAIVRIKREVPDDVAIDTHRYPAP